MRIHIETPSVADGWDTTYYILTTNLGRKLAGVVIRRFPPEFQATHPTAIGSLHLPSSPQHTDGQCNKCEVLDGPCISLPLQDNLSPTKIRKHLTALGRRLSSSKSRRVKPEIPSQEQLVTA